MEDSTGKIQDQQIAEERKAIEEAPAVPLASLQPQSSGMAGRCYWCGRISSDLIYVDTVHAIDRYKGRECCGQRHSH